MPPIHPAIVHYPIALVSLSVIADLLGSFGGNESLQTVGWWSLLGAAIGAALALIAGLFDMNRLILTCFWGEERQVKSNPRSSRTLRPWSRARSESES